MEDIMLDLETLGTAPGSVVLSIGAVEFDPDTDRLGREFYIVINQQSSLNAGLVTDASTVEWWGKQSREAQRVLYATTENNGESLALALSLFSDFVAPCGKSVRIWGNGSDFDQPILTAAYNSVSQAAPWKFWNNRCYRTIKSLRPEIELQRIGTYHNALDDAKSQAVHLTRILKALT
jgi:3' exoribonuclease, RNase T-like